MAKILAASCFMLIASSLCNTRVGAASRVSVSNGGYSYEYTSGGQHPHFSHALAPPVIHAPVSHVPLHHGHHVAQARSFHPEPLAQRRHFGPAVISEHEDIFVGAASAQPPTFAFPSPRLMGNGFVPSFGPRRRPEQARSLNFNRQPAARPSSGFLNSLQQQEADMTKITPKDIRPDPEDQVAGTPTKYQAAKAAADFAKQFHREALVQVAKS